MAKKQSASIMNRLRTLLQPTPEKRHAPGKSAKRSERDSTGSSADAGPADTSMSGAPERDKKKTPNQPWFRHRQRW
jgi:hypothetical protein